MIESEVLPAAFVKFRELHPLIAIELVLSVAARNQRPSTPVCRSRLQPEPGIVVFGAVAGDFDE